jgi:hypothetical protein
LFGPSVKGADSIAAIAGGEVRVLANSAFSLARADGFDHDDLRTRSAHRAVACGIAPVVASFLEAIPQAAADFRKRFGNFWTPANL